ncbi:hypothetical protein LCGC14_2127940, partial [marine sediment metagenome]
MRQRTGLPEDMISRNLEMVETEAAKDEFDVEDFRQENPIFAEWAAENPRR